MNITALKLFSSNLNEQVNFYSKILGLELLERTASKALIRFGATTLELLKSSEFKPYHFAINIPSNQELEALNWLKERVTILTDKGNEIQNFEFWNAKAMYFYDMDNNIVELIARKNTNNESSLNFSAQSFLQISEIGVPVNNVEAFYNSLNLKVNLPLYDGNFERFCAIGDEAGLFICINKNIKDWYPTGDEAFSSDFEIKFEEKGKIYNLVFSNQKISQGFN